MNATRNDSMGRHRTTRLVMAIVLAVVVAVDSLPVPAFAEVLDTMAAERQDQAPEFFSGEAAFANEAIGVEEGQSQGFLGERCAANPTGFEGEAVDVEALSAEELLKGYIQQQFDQQIADEGVLPAQSIGTSGRLGTAEQKAYDILKSRIADVAAGRLNDTNFLIDVSQVFSKTTWTAAELGMPDATIGENLGDFIGAVRQKFELDWKTVLRALLADCPYELYWMDNRMGYRRGTCDLSVKVINGMLTANATGDLALSVCVAKEYSASGTVGTQQTAAPVGASVTKAVAQAKQIVADNSNKGPYQKLVAYREAICDLASYNMAVATDPSVPFGNPWQLVWVFDQDPSTEVVCEGYAKAFKYLCDLTWPKQDVVECITADGIMADEAGDGGHMWNIVRMDDGRNYLVDVTNCDEGTIGYPDKLFMAHNTCGSYDDGYMLTVNGADVLYQYDLDTKEMYGQDALDLSTQAYGGTSELISVGVPTAKSGLVYNGQKQVGVASGTGYTVTGTSFATNAGSYTATAELAEGYQWDDGTTTAKSISWSIAQKNVTVKADNKTKAAGAEDPVLTATVSGVMGDDGVAYTLARDAGENPGSYAIKVTGKTSQGNYAVNYIAGTLTITPRSADVFNDVFTTTAHREDIAWLAETGISEGWTNADGTKSFKPVAYVARADMAAFLFRLAKRWGLVAESWQPSNTRAFLDVKSSTAHSREICWLAENDISTGWSVKGGKEFRPYNTVARQDMAAFLFRLAKLARVGNASDTWIAGADAQNRFVDVDGTVASNHHREVWWLAENGISTGWKVGNTYEFRGLRVVARADMAAFLHRMDGLRGGDQA